MDELLDRPRMFRVIRALGKRAPLNFRQFTEASGHGRALAQDLRERMLELGYITVAHRTGHGNAGVLEIALTSFGQKVAEHVLAIDRIVVEHRGRTPR